MEPLVIPLGTTGLTVADLSLRYYVNGVLTTRTLTATETTPGDYSIGGLPSAGVGTFLTLTWEYPTGVSGVHRWPTQTTVPANLVLPVREDGLVVGDFDFALYLNGVQQSTSTLAVVQLIAGVGDYRLTGLPTTAGSWTLVYRRNGLSFYVDWTTVDSSGLCSIVSDLADLFLDTLVVQPVTLDEFGTAVPSGTVLNLACRIEGEQRLVRDPTGQVVTSTVLVIVAGFNDLTVEGHRYQLPSRYVPNGSAYEDGGLRAIAVDKVSSDDSAECYEELVF